ncbi:hypothetical protein PCS77_16595, partial [Acinetobacter baumannii]|nr:hypothetical protein [Acinetobacter baumannii]
MRQLDLLERLRRQTQEKDHLQDMEQLEMTIVSIQTPYPSI